MRKTVTIAIPIYNGEKYISEALYSILNQTLKVDKILISDNQSTDNTFKIVNAFIEKHPEVNIQLHQNEVNIGCDPNFNKCIELCATDFLVLLGSDDRLKPDSVEKYLKLFEERPDIALIGGLFDSIDHNGKIFKTANKKSTIIFQRGDILEFMKQTGFYMQHSTIMYNMKYTRTIGYFDENYIAPDERFSVEHLIKYPIAQIGEAVADVRFHPTQVTSYERIRFDEKILHFKANLKMSELESTIERKKELNKLLRIWISKQCVSIGRNIWIKNSKKMALKYWLFGIKHNPLIIFNHQFFKIIINSLLYR